MNKIKVGITGQAGFVGTHLYNELGLFPVKYERILFKDSYFGNPALVSQFVKQCDVIVHLAAVNRHPNENELYKININLVNTLIDTLTQEDVKPHIIFSSSTQESLDNPYGKSKRKGRSMLVEWAERNQAPFTALIIPNVYGPFGLPNYNSFVATFCQKLTHGEAPEIITDNDVNLIYVSSLCKHIMANIEETQSAGHPVIQEKHVPFDFTKKVSEILEKLKVFKEGYFDRGMIPALDTGDDINLFNTFRSYIDLPSYFPYRLKQNIDTRGAFVETLRLMTGGQVSFSTTKPNITRGNHFHTHKIERFTVIKGQAKIQLRKIGTDQTIDFYLDGSEPSYVDMPVWYTHNITNIGTGDLYTQFWINEHYNEADPDTYSEGV